MLKPFLLYAHDPDRSCEEQRSTLLAVGLVAATIARGLVADAGNAFTGDGTEARHLPAEVVLGGTLLVNPETQYVSIKTLAHEARRGWTYHRVFSHLSFSLQISLHSARVEMSLPSSFCQNREPAPGVALTSQLISKLQPHEPSDLRVLPLSAGQTAPLISPLSLLPLS